MATPAATPAEIIKSIRSKIQSIPTSFRDEREIPRAIGTARSAMLDLTDLVEGLLKSKNGS